MRCIITFIVGCVLLSLGSMAKISSHSFEENPELPLYNALPEVPGSLRIPADKSVDELTKFYFGEDSAQDFLHAEVNATKVFQALSSQGTVIEVDPKVYDFIFETGTIGGLAEGQIWVSWTAPEVAAQLKTCPSSKLNTIALISEYSKGKSFLFHLLMVAAARENPKAEFPPPPPQGPGVVTLGPSGKFIGAPEICYCPNLIIDCSGRGAPASVAKIETTQEKEKAVSYMISRERINDAVMLDVADTVVYLLDETRNTDQDFTAWLANAVAENMEHGKTQSLVLVHNFKRQTAPTLLSDEYERRLVEAHIQQQVKEAFHAEETHWNDRYHAVNEFLAEALNNEDAAKHGRVFNRRTHSWSPSDRNFETYTSYETVKVSGKREVLVKVEHVLIFDNTTSGEYNLAMAKLLKDGLQQNSPSEVKQSSEHDSEDPVSLTHLDALKTIAQRFRVRIAKEMHEVEDLQDDVSSSFQGTSFTRSSYSLMWKSDGSARHVEGPFVATFEPAFEVSIALKAPKPGNKYLPAFFKTTQPDPITFGYKPTHYKLDVDNGVKFAVELPGFSSADLERGRQFFGEALQKRKADPSSSKDLQGSDFCREKFIKDNYNTTQFVVAIIEPVAAEDAYGSFKGTDPTNTALVCGYRKVKFPELQGYDTYGYFALSWPGIREAMRKVGETTVDDGVLEFSMKAPTKIEPSF